MCRCESVCPRNSYPQTSLGLIQIRQFIEPHIACESVLFWGFLNVNLLNHILTIPFIVLSNLSGDYYPQFLQIRHKYFLPWEKWQKGDY